MLVLKEADLHDQAGMERAFQDYFARVETEQAGTFNAMLMPTLVRCSFEGKTLLLRAELQDWMRNPGGILHGGITASLLDFTMGILARYCTGGRMTPTVSMDVSYLRAGPTEGAVCMEAGIVKPGRRFVHAACTLWTEGHEDRPLASATGVYFVPEEEKL